MNELRRSKIANRRKKSPVFIICIAISIIFIMLAVTIKSCVSSPKDNSSDISSTPVIETDTETSSELEEMSSVSSVSSVPESSKIETSSKAETSSVTTTTSSAVTTTSSKTSTSSAPTSSAPVSSKTESETPTTAYVPNGDWRLVIANKQHPLPESYKVNVSYIGNYRLDSRIVEDYKKMISDARNDGIVLNLISGFRTYEGQRNLFNNKVNQYRNAGYSTEKAKELAAQYVAPPGTSEHLTGLAVDLISTNWYSYNKDLNSGFEKTKEFEWLYNNCAKYGFCLRYPKDKVSITGYSYEPWHYRYVGVEAATEIMNKKICLEEYVATLN